MVSPAEVAVRVIAALIEISEARAAAIVPLSALVALAVDELDPDHLRDTRPTWLQDLPPWARLDALDRLRRAHDQLLVLEVQAGTVTTDLRASLTIGTAHPAFRPLGLTPPKAHAMLIGMAERRSEILTAMGLAERCVRRRLTEATSVGLRAAMRVLEHEETAAAKQQARLSILIPGDSGIQLLGA